MDLTVLAVQKKNREIKCDNGFYRVLFLPLPSFNFYFSLFYLNCLIYPIVNVCVGFFYLDFSSDFISIPCMYFSPRIADSIAARAENIAPIIKAILNDGMNASARVVGNQVVPVSVVLVVAGIMATTLDGKAARMLSTGLYPRKAENKAPDGGMLLRIGASFTAPILASEAVMASGNL